MKGLILIRLTNHVNGTTCPTYDYASKNEIKGRQTKVSCYIYKHRLLKDSGLYIQKNMIVMYYVFIYTSLVYIYEHM